MLYNAANTTVSKQLYNYHYTKDWFESLAQT